LLNHDSVRAFISHGGASSAIEAIYYGKFFIGFPTTEDQPGNSYRIENMKAGVSLRDNPNHKDLRQVIQTHGLAQTEDIPQSECVRNT